MSASWPEADIPDPLANPKRTPVTFRNLRRGASLPAVTAPALPGAEARCYATRRRASSHCMMSIPSEESHAPFLMGFIVVGVIAITILYFYEPDLLLAWSRGIVFAH